MPTETVVNTNGVVVVAPTGVDAATTTAGSCPSAWYSCAANLGGNCCPEGYACGEQCTATASGQSGTQSKAAAAAASTNAAFVSSIEVGMMLLGALICGFGMVAL
jgi:hypothetical protein